MIDWSKLKPYHSTHTQSFEQFCYQVATALYFDLGAFTPIDDTGGGDGVEFFLTLHDGTEWGWQAKFFHPSPRLSVSGRNRQITQSLNRAREVHPCLTKWFLCTPTDFTTAEDRWFKALSTSERPTPELEHWGDSNFNSWMSEPRFVGKLNYFFGELELGIDWFRHQVEKQVSTCQDKYNPRLHIGTESDLDLHLTLGDAAAAAAIKAALGSAKDSFGLSLEGLDGLLRGFDYDRRFNFSGELDGLQTTGALMQASFEPYICQLEAGLPLLESGQFAKLDQTDWFTYSIGVEKAINLYELEMKQFEKSPPIYNGPDEEYDFDIADLLRKVWLPRHHAAQILYKLDGVRDMFTAAARHVRHIIGDAGYGKTHVACNICTERLEASLPAIFLPAALFRTAESPEHQLKLLLDIPSSYSWGDFISALSSAALAYGTRIPIVLDGLNEATANGAFTTIWKLGLPSLISDLIRVKNIVLITTCRSTYVKAIWGDEHAHRLATSMTSLTGFDDEMTERAVENYFAWYRISATITAAPLDQFKHPIYLRLFCEVVNPTRQAEVETHIGDVSLFGIFDRFLNRCNKDVSERLGRHPSASIVTLGLSKAARLLWDNRERRITLDDLAMSMDGSYLADLHFETSITKAVLDEGLLVYRDWYEPGLEMVTVTYDLLAGYVIAHFLLEDAGDNVLSFATAQVRDGRLFGSDRTSRHPLADDIERSFTALLLVQQGISVYSLLQNETTLSLYVDALFEIPPDSVTPDHVLLLKRLFLIPDNRRLLLEHLAYTAAQPNHPLNAEFLSGLLFDLSMAERDISWSQHIRVHFSQLEKLSQTVQQVTKSNNSLSAPAENRLHVVAKYLVWMLTSNVRILRDKVTEALYWYGRRFPRRLLELTSFSLTVNDPYVAERTLAAVYGVAMAKQFDFSSNIFKNEELPKYGLSLYEAMFKEEAPHATTHILMRDYARLTIEIALKHHPDLLSDIQRSRICPPFTTGGIRAWGESNDRDSGSYRNSNAPVQMDFGNYTVGRLIRHRQNYDYANPAYKQALANLFWRIYDLGYTLEMFGDTDSRIAATFRNIQEDGSKTDRYGKKYSWIAFFELYGFMLDEAGLEASWNCGSTRVSDLDVDPSFPEEEAEFAGINMDFVGTSNQTSSEWLNEKSPPDFHPFMLVEDLCNDPGRWVLLDGIIEQEDAILSRKCRATVHTILVDQPHSGDLTTNLQSMSVGSVPFYLEAPSTQYAFAGEIPWCKTFLENGWEDEDVPVGFDRTSATQERLFFYRDGIVLTDDEATTFVQSLKPLFDDGGKTDKEVESYILSAGLTFDRRYVEETAEVPRTEKCSILSPVRFYSWESYHSAVNPGQHVAVPARELTDALRLVSQPQTFDLYELSGERASISVTHHGIGGSWQRLTYIRHDLLKLYLNQVNANLIWHISGERSIITKNREEREQLFEQNSLYKQFRWVEVLK